MKHSRIILSAAAFVVTAAGVFAFKTASKFSSGAVVYGHTVGTGACKVSNCFTTSNAGGTAACKTASQHSLIDHFKKLGTQNCGTAISQWTVVN
jgi:hypothetical protein